ncbi:HI1506-related protein [Solidesulfovibrio sp.]|uniref:HI1506-related protein n=1 Tax=Solidesulfovibrio sp. TaxID=2910990 RepID=UPI002B217758|nr:HI1506-related protein [Solidesulfovibrio sp.]MEA5090817.1 HI1506-related protein [Solidesulfovibrio sp.]
MPKIVRITSTVDGFRRAGLEHPARAVDHPADSITAEQLAALKAEPKLIVQELDLPDAPDGDKGGKKAAEAGK